MTVEKSNATLGGGNIVCCRHFFLSLLGLVGIITPWLVAKLQSDILGAVVVRYNAVEV